TRPAPLPEPLAPAAADLEEDDPPSPANPGYLGPKACLPCHAERVADVLATHHAKSCRVPTPETFPPGFAPGRGPVTTRAPAPRFEMTRDGDNIFQTAVRTTPAGEQ